MNDPEPSSSTLLSRRTLLAGAAMLPVLAACAPLPTDASTRPSTPTPTPTPTPSFTPGAYGLGPVVRGTLNSKAVRTSADWLIYYPPDTAEGDPLPVAIMLHGLGDSIAAVDSGHYSQALYDTVIDHGTPRFAIAAINGGSLFWQKSGSRDAGALVADEFVAELARHGLMTSRLALTGWSMGGWGALRLASNELHGKLKAIAPLSAPCYANFDQIPETGWMTRAEFERNNFYNHPGLLTDLPIFLACGKQDVFYPGNVSFAKKLRKTPGVGTVVTDFGRGAHTPKYWTSVAPAQLHFLGQHLAD